MYIKLLVHNFYNLGFFQTKLEKLTATSVTFSIIGPGENFGLPLRAYMVQFKDERNNDWNFAKNKTWSVDSPYIVENLAPMATYNFRFAARNDVGLGAWAQPQRLTLPKRYSTSIPLLSYFYSTPMLLLSYLYSTFVLLIFYLYSTSFLLPFYFYTTSILLLLSSNTILLSFHLYATWFPGKRSHYLNIQLFLSTAYFVKTTYSISFYVLRLSSLRLGIFN